MFSSLAHLRRPIGILLFSGFALMGCWEIIGGKSDEPEKTCKIDLRKFNPPLDSVMHFHLINTEWNQEGTEEHIVDSGFREARILSIGAVSFSYSEKDTVTFISDTGRYVPPIHSESTFTKSFTNLSNPPLALSGCLEDIDMSEYYEAGDGLIFSYQYKRAELDSNGVLHLDISGGSGPRSSLAWSGSYASGRGLISASWKGASSQFWRFSSHKIERTE